MGWNGYWQYAGTEIINAARTEAYVRHASVPWFRPQYKADDLALLLAEEQDYRTPLLDTAPWVDPTNEDTLDFWGVYPLDVTGVEDSTRTSRVVESIRDGGTAGRLRHATKTVVFNVVLLGAHECAVEAGFQWLKVALLGGACDVRSSDACNGSDLCYFACQPIIDMDQITQVATSLSPPILDGGDSDGPGPVDVDGGDSDTTGALITDMFPGVATTVVIEALEQCMSPFWRQLRRFVFNDGPTVTAKRVATDGSSIWAVTFSGTAGSPWEYGDEVAFIEGFMDPALDDPWPGSLQPSGATYDDLGYVFTDMDCAEPVYTPVFDPLCPAIVVPPTVPNVPLGCYTPPANWRRRQFVIPKEYVPLWGEVAPKVTVHARTTEVRNVRLRFYTDPLEAGDPSSDPCAFCGDIIISYVPAGSSLIFDAAAEVVYVETPGGGRRRADSLVFASDGTPFEWPLLSCGTAYVVTVDIPQTGTVPVLDLSLTARMV